MKILKLILALVLVLGLYFIVNNKKEETKNSQTSEKIKISVYDGDTSSLLLYAKELGYFKNYNLDVELLYSRSGKVAMDKLIERESLYSIQTEFVTVKNSFKNKNFTILASLAEGDINSMLAFKASGIYEAEDIINKKVGVSIGTATEFYMGVFLEQHNLNLEDIQIINVPVKKRYEVMEKREVDALFAWDPYIFNLKKMYKDELNYFPMPVGFSFYFVLTANKEFHNSNPEISRKILSALRDAEIYKDKNPKMFSKFIQDKFNLEDDYLNYTLKGHNYELTLPYSLSITMDKQASWLIKNNLVDGKDFDFSNNIDKKPLQDVNFEAVTLIE